MSFSFRAVAATACCAFLASAGVSRADPAPARQGAAKAAPMTLQSILTSRRDNPRKPGSEAAPSTTPPPPYIYHSTVNDPAQDTVGLSSQFNTTVLDLGGGNLVASYDDGNLTGYAYSSNNGFNWTDAGAPPSVAAGDIGYPALARHAASSTVFLSSSPVSTGGQTVYRSTDFGRTFGSPVNATPGLIDEVVVRSALDVDNFGAAGSGNGNVYVCATATTADGSSTRLVFTRSIDGGASFGPSGGN